MKSGHVGFNIWSFVFHFLYFCAMAVGRDVTRDYFGDVFKMRGCAQRNATRCDGGGIRYAMEIPGRPCYCQCAPSHFTYRDDKRQCVKEIRECYMSVFYRPYAVEAIPLVFLPTNGQLVHPDAHLSLAGRRRPQTTSLPRCKATVSQYMTSEGWRTITRDGGGPVFSLFQDGNKTFLQFLGSGNDRHILQQHLVLVRMFCKIPQYSPFETCVAIRVGWAPGVEPLNSANGGNSKSNMMVVGLSLGVLGMIYVLAVLIYLKLRRKILAKARSAQANKKPAEVSQEEGGGTLSRMDPTKRLEMYHTHSLNRKKSPADQQEDSPAWKPLSLNETYNRNWTDRPGQLGSEFSVQEFQLRPEHFEPEVLASPPQPVIEYLQRLQNSMTYARHRLRMCYRYQPSLVGIPEDDYYYQDKPSEGDADTSCSSISKNFTCRTPEALSSLSPVRSAASSLNSLRSIHPQVPPRRSRRKSKPSESASSDTSNFASQESSNGSETEDEKNQIKSAMDALNDTLDAIEYDIFQQGLLNSNDDKSSSTDSASIKEKTNSETQTTDDELDLKDLDTSSCSSISVVTVLAKLPPINNKLILLDNKSPTNGLIRPASKTSLNSITYATNIESPAEGTKTVDSPKKLIDFSSIGRIPKETSRGSNKAVNTVASKCRSGYAESEVTEITDTDVTELDFESSEVYTTKSSSESVTTAATDMTLDSLDSMAPTPQEVAAATLVDLWISRLAKGSFRRCKHGRKKKKAVESKEKFEHVCSKRRDKCPVHDSSNGSALIDKLATYDPKTANKLDVTSYFQSLKQDVLREHLKGWLATQSAKKSMKAERRSSEESVQMDKSMDTTIVSNAFADSGFQSNRSSMISKTNNDVNSMDPMNMNEPMKTSTPKPSIETSSTKLEETQRETELNTGDVT